MTDGRRVGHARRVRICAALGLGFALTLTVLACGAKGADQPGADAASTLDGAAGDASDDGSITDDADSVATDSPSLFPDVGEDGSAGDAPASCNALTCNGCCMGATCIKNITAQTCGEYGQGCHSCGPDAGYFCKGACIRAQYNCGPSNCAGCCSGTNYCADGVDDVACGTGGVQCLRCDPIDDTGMCLPNDAGPGGTCTTNDCSKSCVGCCENGVCMSGAYPSACGELGVSCKQCSPNEFCDGNKCQPGQPCTPQNCPTGCCGGGKGNLCIPGTADSSCGGGGYNCADCTSGGQKCVNQTCQ
jgi:hypothetical protein